MAQIAVLSTAHIHSQAFCEYLQEHCDGAAVIWDDNRERGQEYAARYGSHFEADLQQVLDDPHIDGFVITAENTRHLELLRQILPLGKPIMCEKPLCTTLSEVQEIATLIQRYKTPLCSGYFMPFAAQAQGLAQLIATDQLGNITHISHRNTHQAAYGRWFDSDALAWFADKKLAGGGALLDLGTHSVHYLRSLFGPVTKVWAHVTNLSGNYATVDDYGVIMLQFANGLLGRIEAGWVQQGGPKGIEIFSDTASVYQSDAGLQVDLADKSDLALPELAAQPDRLDRLLAIIDGRLSADAMAEDMQCCVDAVAIMCATYASAEQGSWVDVEQIPLN